MTENEQRELSAKVVERRMRVANWHRRLFDDEIVDEKNGWRRAAELGRLGYGLIVVANHPSLLDGVKAGMLVAGDEVRSRKPILFPVAWHQYYLARMTNWLLGTRAELKRVVTPHAAQKSSGLARRQGEGLRKYLKASPRVLEEGGTVLLFRPSEREPRVGKVKKDDIMVEGLLRYLSRTGVETFAVTFVGISIPTQESERSRGANLGHKYRLGIGPTLTREEMALEMTKRGLNGDALA